MEGALFKLHEEAAKASSLKELQADIFHHKSLYEKFMKKKAELEEKAAKRNRKCYKAQLAQLYLYECAKNLGEKDKGKPLAKLLCANEKEYLGAAFIYIMKILVALKDNPVLFRYLANSIDASKDVSEEALDKLAEEIIFLLFTDFSSPERSHQILLKHMDYLLPELFKTCKMQKKAYPFEVPFFVNRLLWAYVKRPEIRAYTRLLFTKTMAQVLEISTRIPEKGSTTPEKRPTIYSTPERRARTDPIKKYLLSSNGKVDGFEAPISIIRNYINGKIDETTEPTSPPEKKPDVREIDGMQVEEMFDICDEMLDNIE